MKIQLTIVLDLPEETRGWSMGELRQNVFDAYVNYATVCHLRDACKWLCEKSPNAPIIANHHSLWGDICNVDDFDLKVLDPTL